MFTPQRKAWSTVSHTPQRSGAGTSSNIINPVKGKALAVSDDPPPPLGSLSEAREGMVVGLDAGSVDDWKKFKEVGLLDEALMQKKDQEALFEKLSRLERELFDYQYNMGLLLIEKKEWSSKFDQLRQELAETEEILKREQSAHLIALSEAEKRGENLKKALITEKQCGADLERALRALQEEHAQVHSSSQTKLNEANALVDGIEEKSSVVNKKLHDAEAKLAEVNRKSAELDMKLRELEVRDSLLQKERLSIATDRESFEATFYKQREDLKEWERKLQQREDILCEGRRNLREREEKAIETEKSLKQKERDLEVLEKNIDSSKSLLKEKEAVISRRVADLDVEEKRADSLKIMLETKEKELFALELKLNARESEGIHKLLGGEKGRLDLKLQQFELEMEQMRRSLNEEFSSKVEALEQREAEVNHRETKVVKEEQALIKKGERIKEQNKELESKLKSLKEKEKTMKVGEKELEKEKQQLLADRESLDKLKMELEKMKTEVSQQELQIYQESENLKITEDERSEHSRLQLELQQEIEHTRLQKELLLKEAENLREDRQRFEKEWEVLDEKNAEISRGKRELDSEKEKYRRLQHTEEERLKREKQDMDDHIKKELEKLELENKSFIDSMKQEELLLYEKMKSEKAHMLQDFEWKTRSLEHEIQKRREEMEAGLQERERKFQEEMERELNNINVLKDVTEKEWEEVKSETFRLENEKKELESNKQQLKSSQREMHEDSEMLMNLSRKVKKERERLVAERNHFLALVEKLRGCKGCEEVVRDFVVSDLQLPECKERGIIPSPSSFVLNDSPLNNSQDNEDASELNYSGSVKPVSWLRKCTWKIFKFSPGKRVGSISASYTAVSSPVSDVNADIEKVDRPASLPNIEVAGGILGERELSGWTAHHSSDIPNPRSDNIIREVDDGYCPSIDDHSYVDSLIDVGPDDSQQSVRKSSRHRSGRKSKSGAARSRAVKTLVQEAKEFLGKAPEEMDNASLQSLNIGFIKEDSREDSSHTEKAIGQTRKKRQRSQTSRIAESELSAGDSEGHSDSVTTGGHRRKRQTVAPPVQVTGEKRYNLRRHKTAGMASSAQVLLNGTKSVEEGAANPKLEVGQSLEVASGPSSVVADDNVQTTCLLQVTTAKKLEITDDGVVRFNVPRDMVDDNGTANNSVEHVYFCAEVNGTEDYEDEDGSTIHEVENGNKEEEEEHPGEVSIGKKILEFFTS